MNYARAAPPSDDKRWKIVDATMRRLGYRRDALIEALHSVQEAFGYLDEESLRYVARSLRLPLSAVYGAATFYHFFTLKPPGRHTCVVCTGTACHIKGAPELLGVIEREYGVKPGQTTPDGKLSLLTARCVGS
ncbi:MAG: NAD(P)H-dependent oxidoreductase subunit E, partial [Bryobacteraceae bacterium]